jgi:hypothetical protein
MENEGHIVSYYHARVCVSKGKPEGQLTTE